MSRQGLEPEEGPVRKSGGYFQVPDLVFDLHLTANEKLVLIYFMRRADREGRSFPSVERICRDCGFGSRNTAYKAIKNLVKAGLIHREPVPGRSHNYFVSEELYRVIVDAKARHKKKRDGFAATFPYMTDVTERVTKTSPACSEYEHRCSNNEQPAVQNMNTKEYTVEGSSEKEYTVKEEARKTKSVHEEAHASSSLADPVDDNKVTMLDVAEHLHTLTPQEKKDFDMEAYKLVKPGEPDPRENLWQKRLLRVRYLRQLRDGGG